MRTLQDLKRYTPAEDWVYVPDLKQLVIDRIKELDDIIKESDGKLHYATRDCLDSVKAKASRDELKQLFNIEEKEVA